jgi:hypothetical protein
VPVGQGVSAYSSGKEAQAPCAGGAHFVGGCTGFALLPPDVGLKNFCCDQRELRPEGGIHVTK